MKISEYTLLQEAWDRSFGFMLNRIEDEMGTIPGRWVGKGANMDYEKEGKAERARERCFSEFVIALDDLGVELGDLETVRKPLPPPGEEV
jgi:hypothetical protein